MNTLLFILMLVQGTRVTYDTVCIDNVKTKITTYYDTIVDPAKNLMVNGGFESGYTGFTSNYLPIKKNGTPVVNPTSVYKGGRYDNNGDYGKYYMIINNAGTVQEPSSSCKFASIRPHGGNEFLLVDATNEGYAWKTSTTESPDLKLVQNKEYIFSYWYATPNTGKELNHKATLVFVVEYDANGGHATVGLDTVVVSDSIWHQSTKRWTAPMNSSNVSIGVMDTTNSAEGNDFCLDDIVFQPTDSIYEKKRDPQDTTSLGILCQTCTELIYRKTDNLLIADNGKDEYTAWQWYRDSVAISGAIHQYYQVSAADTLSNTAFYVVATKADGSQVNSCTESYGSAPSSATSYKEGTAPKVVAVRYHEVGAHFRVKQTIYSDGSSVAEKQIQ